MRWRCKKGRQVYLSIGQPQSLVNKWIENSCTKVIYVSSSCRIGLGFSLYARVVSAQILMQTVQLIFSTIRFRSYWCCVGKARSTIEKQVFCSFSVVCCSLAFWLKRFHVRMYCTKAQLYLKKRPFFKICYSSSKCSLPLISIDIH
jgi:hypothetical protein